jgi:hypothetical protein
MQSSRASAAAQEPAITSLEEMLDRIDEAADGADSVSVECIVDALGRRSFGPLLLFAGVVTLSPVGDIPGVPTIVALLVVLIAAQFLAGRERFWLPRWLLNRTITRRRLQQAQKWLKPPARFVDRGSRPRLRVFTRRRASHVIAIVCIAIAAAMPPMEFVPFTATGAGAALTAFGLALVAHDGLLALLAFVFTAATMATVVYKLV